ncbi:MAG: phenylalanine 4-monooxygenase [Sphingomonadales bacterium]|nr:phenylalanine 4-monooxygenase [Sphingomonadales bacterium]
MTALGREVEVNADYTVDQGWESYTAEEHDRWDRLFARQVALLEGRAAPAFMSGLEKLKLSDGGIPDFRALSERLKALTGWTVVAVPDLVPEDVFFDHLANRRFPAGNFIRPERQLDYLEEPDVFHDVFGHVPMLAHPNFANYMEAYGKGGQRAANLGVLDHLARLYWYTVEFGLVNTDEGLRIYGAGIVSSKGESVFALESPSPNRVHFDLERVMTTDYRIDDYQQTYFVIDGFRELLAATLQDFGPVYERVKAAPTLAIDAVLETDKVYTHGTQEHAARVA